ncbi:MAG: tRNA lysidine(34) synthetase TilS, partial [Eggerthellaceae bacterium]|nr:tRNA lysidine(34) synthetase TilS [Eggerthellaceae bacterium]
HVNHKIRAHASDADQAFVTLLAETLAIPLFICEIDIPAKVAQTGENEEALARKERYLAANEALESHCLQSSTPLSKGRIFTAHTQDDRVENFYMRSIVGTGPGGFRSMPYANGPVVRPLLDISREELRSYLLSLEASGLEIALDSEGMLWREDATNAHTDKFRAFVRHEIIPLAKKRNPALLDTLCRVMNLIGDEDDMLDGETAQLEAEFVSWLAAEKDTESGIEAACRIAPGFAKLPLAMKRRLVLAVLQRILGPDARLETTTVEAVLAAFSGEGPQSGYTANIQGDLAISANKQGVLIEAMSAYRARRKKI